MKNCSYYVTKHNSLLPADTYTFDANGQMINPPATASVYGVERATPLATIVEEYDYVYIGSQLVQMSVSTTRNGGTETEEVLNFAYDASGMPATVSYNGVTYYYITNLQGDVLAIVDGHGATLVEYEYDPYGRLRSMSGVMSTTLGEANPLRYRGYVYDTESRLYYLQSRYYDPKIGRFINADSFASTGQGILGFNMFAYCNNNPVVHVDASGNATQICFSPDGRQNYAPWRDSGCGGWPQGIYTSQQDYGSVADKFYTVRAVKYILNTDEQVVLDAEYFAFYKGALVLKLGFLDRSGFSFGIIGLGPNVDAATVQHEYGHFFHLCIIGPENYITKVAIPSLIDYNSDIPYELYYSEPQECIADILGGVQRTYRGQPYPYSISPITAFIYFIYSLI